MSSVYILWSKTRETGPTGQVYSCLDARRPTSMCKWEGWVAITSKSNAHNGFDTCSMR